MSQHVVIDGDKKWVYGWDQPLMTFYLQVHDASLDEEENPVVWHGTGPSSTMYEVEDLVAFARKHGLEIPYKMQVQLYGEKDDGV